MGVLSRFAVVALAAGASAFSGEMPVLQGRRAPAATMQKSQAIPFLNKPSALDGSMVGDIGFDPLLLSDVVPLSWAREAELKHGRVCMLAFAGWVAVDAGLRFPEINGPWPDVKSVFAHDAAVDNGSFLLLLWILAAIEIGSGIPKVLQLMNDPDAAPAGDYKFDPLGFGGGPALAEKEIIHCRAAMIGFSGICTQSVLTDGAPFPYTYNGLSDIIPPLGDNLVFVG